MPSRRYKDYRFYAFVALNLISSTLEIYIFQKGLDRTIGPVLESQEGVSKSAIMHEIRSNHNMTNKVIKYLEEEGLVGTLKCEGEYRIKITRRGITYLREYSRFYASLFKREIDELYRYRALPTWASEPSMEEEV